MDTQIKIEKKGQIRLMSLTSWNLLSANQKAGWNVVGESPVKKSTLSTNTFSPPEIKNVNMVKAVPISKNGEEKLTTKEPEGGLDLAPKESTDEILKADEMHSVGNGPGDLPVGEVNTESAGAEPEKIIAPEEKKISDPNKENKKAKKK